MDARGGLAGLWLFGQMPESHQYFPMLFLDTLKLADSASKRAVSKENGFRIKLLEALDLQIAAVKPNSTANRLSVSSSDE